MREINTGVYVDKIPNYELCVSYQESWRPWSETLKFNSLVVEGHSWHDIF